MSGYTWVSSGVGRAVPPGALECGRDTDGSPIYVGRTNFQGEQLPCKVVPNRREAYISNSQTEHKVTNYELLCQQHLQWVRNSGGYVPPGAVAGGRTKTGENLYIGRTQHANATTVGKVHPSHGCLYIPYGGNEVSYKDYEILVMK